MGPWRYHSRFSGVPARSYSFASLPHPNASPVIAAAGCHFSVPEQRRGVREMPRYFFHVKRGQMTVVLAQNIFGVGIDGGRSWNMYFGSGQYIGDICDGARNEWIFWAPLHVSTTVEKCRDPSRRSGRVGPVMPRDVHSDDVDRRPLGTRQSCLQKEAVCGEAADNPCRVRDVSWSSDDIENTPRGRCASASR